MPRQVLDAGVHTCAECETHLAVFEGPTHARNYKFPARQVATALIAVGQGVSYYGRRGGAAHRHRWDHARRIGMPGARTPR
jgi:hypothetical protein